MLRRGCLGLLPTSEPVHLTRPYLHHKSLFWQECRPIVGSSVGGKQGTLLNCWKNFAHTECSKRLDGDRT